MYVCVSADENSQLPQQKLNSRKKLNKFKVKIAIKEVRVNGMAVNICHLNMCNTR